MTTEQKTTTSSGKLNSADSPSSSTMTSANSSSISGATASIPSVKEESIPSSKPTIALIDGDILCYRIGFASEDVNEGLVKARIDEFISEMLMDLDVKDYYGYLTGEGNFRHGIAVTAPYKGNRSGAKPIHYNFIREYLEHGWDFGVIHGEEADDAISIDHTKHHPSTVICSIDKDFDQLEGWHYNFVKRKLYYVGELEGIRNFYQQILTGDRVDNVIGIRGCGPVRSARIVAQHDRECALYKAVVDEFGKDAEHRVIENGKLLWLRRYPGQLWEPPCSVSESGSE